MPTCVQVTDLPDQVSKWDGWSTVRTIDVSYVAGDIVNCLTRYDMAHVEHSLSRYFGLLR